MKRLLLILIICLSSLSAHAQHFDWVKSYFGPDYENGDAANDLYGSVMDSEGNIYILGHFLGGARWDDDTGILPFSAHSNRSAVIAKFSPDGEIVWHKELYSSYTDVIVYTIRMVGDTALMLYAWFMLPFDYGLPGEKNELYYFDTLLTSADHFPASPDSLLTPNYCYAFITLGLESGDIIEEHFFALTYVKNDGSMLRSKYSDLLITNEIQVSFNVDSEGNIILARQTNDKFYEPCDTCPDGVYWWSPNEGNISTMRLMVDGATKQLDVPLELSSRWNWQIIKLSPHLDSVIASTYVFDSTWLYSEYENISLELNSIDVDANNNIDILLLRIQDPVERWPVKNSDSLALEWYSCLLRYNSELTPKCIAQVTGSYTPNGYIVAGSLTFLSTQYDDATESLFINGNSGRRPQYSTVNYRGDTLNLMNNACWLRLNANDFSLISYSRSRNTGQHGERTYFYSDKYGCSHNGSFVAKDNRVFCQVKYIGNILFQNTQFNNHDGMGLFVWDYDGHELEYIDYNSLGSNNEQGYIFLKDSSLWLTGTFTADADFGSFHVNAAYNSHAYLAKYTDTAFMTPYVYTDPHTEQIDETEQPICQIYPNPTSDNLFINVTDEQISNVYIISSLGKRKEIKVFGNRVSLSDVPSGIYYLQIITNRNIYKQKIIKI